MGREDNVVLEKNLQALLPRFPEWVQLLSYHREGYNRRRCELLEGPSLKITFKDKSIAINSTRNPHKEAERLATQAMSLFPDSKNVALKGFGMGFHVEEILKRMNEDATLEVQIVDLLVFRMTLESRDLSELLSDKRLMLSKKIEGLSFDLLYWFCLWFISYTGSNQRVSR